MKIALRKPITWEEKTYSELDLDLDALTGKELLSVGRELNALGQRLISPNTDACYHAAVAARAARVPLELIQALSARDFTRITLEVQGFLLGVDSESTSEES